MHGVHGHPSVWSTETVASTKVLTPLSTPAHNPTVSLPSIFCLAPAAIGYYSKPVLKTKSLGNKNW